ncbi:hypothetical protein [Methylotenera versatilis]|uniref:hypothetical protein n=1 Tax=Methylotenera versatilis TaxID=1055487 RepID=UPI000647B8F3|nr:hypothetical protein [Methylotenera versatilis]
MLIKNIKTSKDLNPSEPADLATIVREVKQHGFYSAFCTNLVPDIADHDVLMSEIKKLAIRAQLQVTFNAEESICIFEADDKA